MKITALIIVIFVAILLLAIYSPAGQISNNPLPILTNVSSAIGGGALLAGACASTTVAVTGAATTQVAVASPNTYPGDGNFWVAYVSSANTVTVKVCASVAATPTSSTYNVRVVQ